MNKLWTELIGIPNTGCKMSFVLFYLLKIKIRMKTKSNYHHCFLMGSNNSQFSFKLKCTPGLILIFAILFKLNLFAQSPGAHIEKAPNIGLYIQNSSNEGIRIDSTNYGGMFIDNNIGISIIRSQNIGLQVYDTGNNGITVEFTDEHGIAINNTEKNGISIKNPKFHGIDIHNPVLSGIVINNAGGKGIDVVSPIDEGIFVTGGTDGFRSLGANDDGVQVGGAEDDGVFVRNVGSNGLRVNNAGINGVFLDKPNQNGVSIIDAGTNGINIDNTGDNGILIKNTQDNGMILQNSSDGGIIIDGTGTIGLNIMDAGSHGIRIENPGADGLTINEPMDDGIIINAPDDDGIDIIQAGNDGINIQGAGGAAAQFFNNPTSTTPALILGHGDDSDYDLAFSGIGRVSAKQQFNFRLDEDDDCLDCAFNITSSTGLYSFVLTEAGHLGVLGNISKGGGSFKIDHPLDPYNKYLYHSFVESPDMMNVYNGNVILDNQGQATIKMEEWFEALNRDFRYQLTPIGGSANLYIAEKMNKGEFIIAGGAPGLEVSWQVTGIRHDPYANKNRIETEVEKEKENKGNLLHPDAYRLEN